MPGVALAFILGILSAGIATAYGHRLQRSPAGRTPDDPLPPPPGVLPPEADLVLPELEPADPVVLRAAFAAAAPRASRRALRILVAHALVAGGGLVINHNVLWLPARPAASSTSRPWTMAVVEAITPEGVRYRLRPVRAFASPVEGARAAVKILPSAGRAAAQRGNVDGYVAALVTAKVTTRNPRLFAAALRAAYNDLAADDAADA